MFFINLLKIARVLPSFSKYILLFFLQIFFTCELYSNVFAQERSKRVEKKSYSSISKNDIRDISFNKKYISDNRNVNSENYIFFYEKGDFFHNVKNDFENALYNYTKAIELNPQFYDAYVKRADVLSSYVDKAYGKAIEDLSKAIELKPDYFVAYYLRGQIYYHLIFSDINLLDKALKDYSKAIELNPSFIESYMELCSIYTDGIHDYEKGLANCNKVIEIFYKEGKKPDREIYDKYFIYYPDDFLYAYLARGKNYFYLEKYDRAINDFTEYINNSSYGGNGSTNLDHLVAYEKRALAFASLSQYNKALSDLNTMLKLDPNDVFDAYLHRGRIYYQLENYNKAVEDFTMGIQIGEKQIKETDSEDVSYLKYLYRDLYSYYFARGVTFEVLKKYGSSFDDFKKASYYCDLQDSFDCSEIEEKLLKIIPFL